MASGPPSSRDDFEIAIVCALALEFDAVVPLLDSIWDEENGSLGKAPGDLNTYVNGRIGQNNVVLVCLPQRMGKASAAIVATDLRHSYRNLRLALLVGICGGVPKAGSTEVVLGDVVISTSIVQYDFGRHYPDGFRRKDSPQDNLNGPNKEIRGLLAMFGTDYGQTWLHEKTAVYLKHLQGQKPKYAFPGAENDRLFQPGYRHKHQISPSCDCQHHEKESDPVCKVAIEASCNDLGCDPSFLVKRVRLEEGVAACDPIIHIGPVASGDSVMKSGTDRDRIASKEGVIAFEMEAAGIWEHLPSLVVKGVCDYADSHKSKGWQNYAAATASSAAKAILIRHIPTEKPVTIDARADMSQPAFKPRWVLPLPPDPEFVDRPDILAWLSEKSTLPGARVALVGLGGIGKSQLAIQFAHRVRKQSHVFWVNATTRRSLEESYRAIAEKLGLSMSGDSLDVILRRVADWLGCEENGRWTVLLDNFDDSSILSAEDPHLSALLPQASNGFTVITSRALKAAEQLTGSANNIFSLVSMNEEEAFALLSTKLKRGCEREEGQELVQLLDHMPLAISQAAAYINHRDPRVSVRQYIREFQTSDERKKVLLNWEFDDLRRSHDASNSVLGTWIVTFDQILRDRPSAIDLLSFMIYFQPQSIPQWVLRGYKGVRIHPRPTIGDIVTSSKSPLLSLIPTSLHSSHLHEEVSDEIASRVWTQFEHGNSSTRSENKKAEKSWRPRLHSLAGLLLKEKLPAALKRRPDNDGKCDTVVSVASVSETDLGDAPAVDEEFNKDLDTLLGYSLVTTTAKEGMLKMHPLVHYCTRDWLSRSGRTERWKRRFLMVMAADFHHRETVELSIHLDSLAELEPGDPLEARLWALLFREVADHWDFEGRFKDGTKMLRRLLSVGDSLLGKDDHLTLTILFRLTTHFIDAGLPDEAEWFSREQITRWERSHDINSLGALQARQKYAHVISDLGRYEEAEQILQGIIERSRKSLGPHAYFTHYSMGLHAQILAYMGRGEDATQLVVQLLREEWEGDCEGLDSDVVFHMETAARAIAGYPQHDEAEPLLREIVEAYQQAIERVFKERQTNMYMLLPQTPSLPFYDNLAKCLTRQGRLDEAKSILRRGVQCMAKVYPGSKIPPPYSFATLLELQEEYEAAERTRRDTLEYWEGPGNGTGINIAISSLYLGRLLYSQGKVDEGTHLLQKGLMSLTEDLGENYVMTVAARTLYDKRELIPESFRRKRFLSVGALEDDYFGWSITSKDDSGQAEA
jgi:nucleoside phosphorylase/tetratricopeptide (TPR) repeat protein